jgi:hypothetical protein
LADEEGDDIVLNVPDDPDTDTAAKALRSKEEREEMVAVLRRFDGAPLASVITANLISPHPLVTAAVSVIEYRSGSGSTMTASRLRLFRLSTAFAANLCPPPLPRSVTSWRRPLPEALSVRAVRRVRR